MKTRVQLMMAILLLMVFIITSCKKDEETQSSDPIPEPGVPTWLVALQGTYFGTYNGDDVGYWKFTIEDSPNFIMNVTPQENGSGYARIVTISENAIFTFSDQEILLIGTISDDKQVSGTWEELIDNTSGEFQGSTEPESTNMLMDRIIDKDGNLRLTYEYDAEGRNIRTDYYTNNSVTDYAIREWDNNSFSYTSYNDDGSISYQYKNPYPPNGQGMTTYATYMKFRTNYTRYDTCYYLYDENGYKVKELRDVYIFNNNSEDEIGTEERSYTYTDGNLTKIVIEYAVGNDIYTSIYNNTYYSQYVDYRNVLAPYLGKSSLNLIKNQEVTYSDLYTDYSTEYQYELFSNGMVKVISGKTVYQSSVNEFNDTYFYK